MAKHRKPDTPRRLVPNNGKPAYTLKAGEKCLCLTCDYPVFGSNPGKLKRKIREGRVIYIHPEGRFITVEFEGQADIWTGMRQSWRMALAPEDVQRYSTKGKNILLAEPPPVRVEDKPIRRWGKQVYKQGGIR